MQKIRGSRAAAADARRKERARRGEAQCKGRSRQHLDWGILWAVCVGMEEAQAVQVQWGAALLGWGCWVWEGVGCVGCVSNLEVFGPVICERY